MNNHNIEAAWAYHNGTKHSYSSIRTNQHYLDWANQPLPFKIYQGLEPIPLPRESSSSQVPALAAISSLSAPRDTASMPDLKTLAQLLYFSAGITRRRAYPGGEILFRAAACTGALYHIELYLICGDVPGLEAGVYHFGVHDFALRRLRKGDYRQILVKASGDEPAVCRAPAIVVCTGTFWRNAWKYQARSYRHSYWDNGTILANLLAVTSAHEIPARVVCGFVDSVVNQLLGLDPHREVGLTMVPLGITDKAPSLSPALEPLELETVPLSKSEVDYPAIRGMHAASSLDDEEEARRWRCSLPEQSLPETNGQQFPLAPHAVQIPPAYLEQVILRRGSTRRFAQEPITLPQLSTMLHCATRGIPADFLDPPGSTLNEIYLIANAVEGLPSGAYYYRRDQERLELLREGDFRQDAGYLGLEQELPADASVDVFFLAGLNPVLQQFGNRGYRAAQLEAGIMGGKMYLAAYALGLGASGLTFYDDDVAEFFSPHAKGKSTMLLLALGKSARAASKTSLENN